MVSIERNEHDKARFEFNRPFKCIQIKFGESNDILPSLQWNVKTILWLDYDTQLDDTMLTDISFFCATDVPGSVIIVTVNAHTPAHERPKRSLQKLEEKVGKEKVPLGVTGKDLKSWGEAKVYRKIITNEIFQTLTQRNGGLEVGNQIKYKQLFNFHYADGARMLTVGGLLYAEKQSKTVAKCAFDNLSFFCSDDKPYKIEIPNLTYRELRRLDEHLPVADVGNLQVTPIPEEDVEKYARVYRYFPTFAETEM